MSSSQYKHDLQPATDMPMIDRCLICGSSGHAAAILSSRLRDERSGRFKVARCWHCGHAQMCPLPSAAEEAAYYDQDAQPKSLWGDKEYLSILRARAAMDINRRLDWIAKDTGAATNQTLLDIGCGYGFFINAAAGKNYRATGIDVSESRLSFARREMSGTFIRGDLNDEFAATHWGKFDIITCFHVLEHVRQPEQYVRLAMSLLAPKGVLLFEVPNLADCLADYVPTYADHLWQIAHLSYFDAPRLELLFQKAGVTNFTIKGKQRYGLRHLVRWTDLAAPDLQTHTEPPTNPVFDEAESAYRAAREGAMTCDTLIATLRR